MALNLMKTQRRLITLLWLCLTLAGILVYLPGLPGGFVFDDLESIVYNPAMQLHTLSFGDLYTAMLSSPTGGLMRPLSMLSFALDSYFFGLIPLPFKLTNIAIHVGCGLLLWCVAREILRAYGSFTGRALQERAVIWMSTAAAGLWLVHPLNLTSVLYSVQRETSLSALFTAAAMLSYLVGRRHEREGSPARALIWFWTPVFTALGMLCKETAVLLPVYLCVAETTLLKFKAKDGRRSANASWFMVFFLAAPLCYELVRFLLQPPGYFAAWYIGRGFTLYERLISESRVLLDYLRWVFIPDIRQLALYHDDVQASHGLLDPPTTLISIVAVCTLAAAAIALRKRLPLLSFALLWFFGGHLLESTVIPLELMFEHRNYLPLFGLITGITGTLWTYAANHKQERSIKLIIGAYALVFACTTAMRAWEWHSEMSFAEYEAAHQPHSPRALAELGWSYSMYLNVTQDYSIIPYAVDAELREKAADPLSIAPDISIADIYAVTHDMPKAAQYLRSAAEVAKIAEPTPTFQFSLQTLRHWRTDNYPELKAVIDSIFLNAIDNPKMGRSSCYLAGLVTTYGVLQDSNGNIPAAAQLLHRATVLCPGDALMRINFAYLLLRYNDPKDARAQVEAVRRLNDIRYFGQLELLERSLAEQSAAVTKPSD